MESKHEVIDHKVKPVCFLNNLLQDLGMSQHKVTSISIKKVLTYNSFINS
jgi:hypothetical protein